MLRRAAFTLVEILVAMTIMVVLLAVVASALPRILSEDRVSQGAGSLQGWLWEARQQAQRDRASTGLRLYADPGTALVRKVQPIQGVDPWNGGGTLDCILGSCNAAGVDFSAGLGATEQAQWPVLPGDYVLFSGSPPRQILLVAPTFLTLAPGNGGFSCPATPSYTIVRKPRTSQGEGFRYLPSGAVADVGLAQIYGAALTPGPYLGTWDVLFQPSGTLAVGYGGSQGRLLLWVRPDNADQTGNTFTGPHALVSVLPSGVVRVDGLDPVGSGGSYADPFSLTRDVRPGGF